MSGGEYNYAYRRVEEFANDMLRRHSEIRHLRIGFYRHLQLVAEAMRAVEWTDSGDGGDEEGAIRACLPKNTPLEEAVALTDQAFRHLAGEIRLGLPYCVVCLDRIGEGVDAVAVRREGGWTRFKHKEPCSPKCWVCEQVIKDDDEVEKFDHREWDQYPRHKGCEPPT